MRWLGKNWKQGFGFMPNLSKRSEAHAIHRTTAGPSDYRVPEDVNAADELESIVEGQDEEKLRGHGGVEGIADKRPTSAESPSRGIWFFDSEALQRMTYLVLWSRYAVCASVSLIVGIMIERWSKCALDGLAIGASILLVVFACANSDYNQSLQSKDLHAQQEKIAVPVTRNGIGQKRPTHDLRPGEIVHLNIGDQVPADGLFITGGSLLENESSLAGDGKPVNASGVGIPFLLPGTEVQYWITQDACDPYSNDRACASDDLIRQLVHDLKSGCLDKQKQAASKIRLLTKNKSENRIRIARADAIEPLIALILSPDSQAQEYSVTAIHNLSICDENKELIAASGAIESLAEALRTGMTTVKENAACALFRLSQIEEKKVAIGRSGAIPPLVNLLGSRGSQGKKDASAALYSLCFVEENKVRAVQAGAMRPLVEMMADLGSSTVDMAVGMVITLMGAVEARATLVKEGGIPVLVKTAEGGTHRQKQLAVEVLLQLCKDSVEYQTKAVQAGVIRPLVELMADLGSSMVERAAFVVRTLVGAAEARAALVEEGGIPVLVRMAKVGKPRQKEIAVVVLFQLCKDSVACQKKAVQEGAMRPLVELMADLGSSIGDKAAVMVSMLVGAAEARAALVEERGIPVLVKMVEEGTQRQKEIAVGVLLQLCEDSIEYRTMVANEGVIPPLVALSQSGTNPGKQKAETLIRLLPQLRSDNAVARTKGEHDSKVEPEI